MSLGSQIKRLRQLKGWTQQQLADYANMHVNSLNRIETGSRLEKSLTVNNLQKIAKALGVRVKIEFEDSKSNAIDSSVQDGMQCVGFSSMEIAQHYLDMGIHFNIMYWSANLNDIKQEELYFEAKSFYLRALGINKDFYEAWCYLGHLVLRRARRRLRLNLLSLKEFQRELEMARCYYAKAEKIYPEHHRTINNQINLLLAEYYFLNSCHSSEAQSKLICAKNIILNHIHHMPSCESMFVYNLACVYANLGDTEQSIKLLHNIFKENSTFYRPIEQELVAKDDDLLVLHNRVEFMNWLENI